MAGGEDGADGVGDDTELRRFSDVELLEKSRRIQGELSGGIERRLKDRGAKFRRLLDAIVREIDRRKAATVRFFFSSFFLCCKLFSWCAVRGLKIQSLPGALQLGHD